MGEEGPLEKQIAGVVEIADAVDSWPWGEQLVEIDVVAIRVPDTARTNSC